MPGSRQLGSIRSRHRTSRIVAGLAVLSVLASKIQTWSHLASASRARRDCPKTSEIVVIQREISILLDPYGIHPDVIHPKGKSARGYKVEWFETAWRHYLHRELRDLQAEPRKRKPSRKTK